MTPRLDQPTQPPGHPPTDERVLRMVAFFETLTPASLATLPSVYSEQAQFIDPFNAVRGLPAIHRVFEHMFEQLHQPRFEVLQTITEGEHCFLLWDFHFDGRVNWHRDHWDPAREIYETVPLLGGLLRWLRRRLQA
jgi:steroid Delta-isomerase